jgi:ribosomal protein S18 acetylase RimI-like enzyme
MTQLWTFCPISKQMSREDFDCGKESLNLYLRQSARQHHEKGISKTFVALPDPKSTIIAGYYSVCMAQIEFLSMPSAQQKGIPREYPIPAMRITRLAVDKTFQGQKLGEELLMEALNRALRLSSEVAICAVVVDAIDDRAKQFYLKYDFIVYEDRPQSLFLTMKQLQKL